MGTARVLESFWTCAKRRRTELALARAGHRWPTDPARGPMSAAECLARILAFLDGRDDSTGSLNDVSDEELEVEAGWTGRPGLLARTLLELGWLDVTDAGRCWHHYEACNSRTITGRLRNRALRNRRRNDPRNEPRDCGPTSGSGSGSGSEEQKKNPAAAAVPAPDGADDVTTSAPRTRRRPDPSEEGRALASELLAAIRSHSPDALAPPSLDGWARDLDLAMRRDRRTPEQLRAAIAFAHRDARGHFWRGNVLSGAALRKQFDRLRIQSRSGSDSSRRNGAAPASDSSVLERMRAEAAGGARGGQS